MESKLIRRKRRAKKVRAKVSGTKTAPRLSVFRSNKRIYAQVIDDIGGITITAASDYELGSGQTKLEKARVVGQKLGEKLLKLGIKFVRFDRGGYLYHGRVKALAEGVRAAGVKF